MGQSPPCGLGGPETPPTLTAFSQTLPKNPLLFIPNKKPRGAESGVGLVRTLASLLHTQGSGGLSVSYHQGFSGHLCPLRISIVTLCLVLSRIRVTASQLVETVLSHLPHGELQPSRPLCLAA